MSRMFGCGASHKHTYIKITGVSNHHTFPGASPHLSASVHPASRQALSTCYYSVGEAAFSTVFCARETPSSAALVQPGFFTERDDLRLHVVARVTDTSLVGAGGISPSVDTRPSVYGRVVFLCLAGTRLP